MNRPLLSRPAVVFAARAGAVGSAVMLALTAFTLSPGEVHPAGAAGTQIGVAAVITPDDGSPGGGQPLAGGNSETPFSFFLGDNPTCPGDSANAGYFVGSFMVGSNVDVASLQFEQASGPIPALTTDDHDTLRLPLFKVDGGSFYMGDQTADANPPGGPGPIVNIPPLVFAAPAGITPGDVPPGDYKIGVACLEGGPSDTQLSNFWVAEISVVSAATGGGSAEFTWSVVEGSTTTTTGSGSTSTTASGGSTTSTTAAGGSTTTLPGGSTTSTTDSGGTTSSTSSSGTGGTTSGGTTGGVSGSGGSLPSTGSSPAALVMWAFFLVVCGRMAVVLSRPPKVKTPGA